MEWVQFIIMFLAMIGLFTWNRSESNADRRDILNLIRSIDKEMTDFHGRLERQDAEFKGAMKIQDADFKSAMKQQDADFKAKIDLRDMEFKNHLMHDHQGLGSQIRHT